LRVKSQRLKLIKPTQFAFTSFPLDLAGRYQSVSALETYTSHAARAAHSPL